MGKTLCRPRKAGLVTECVHCGRPFRDASKLRRFCWPCRVDPAIRDQHPSDSKHARRSSVGLWGVRDLPEPTDALPGTERKIAVMEARAATGQLIHHPEDARY